MTTLPTPSPAMRAVRTGKPAIWWEVGGIDRYGKHSQRAVNGKMDARSKARAMARDGFTALALLQYVVHPGHIIPERTVYPVNASGRDLL
jgi:hypothetical protein